LISTSWYRYARPSTIGGVMEEEPFEGEEEEGAEEDEEEEEEEDP
jgi:hypothetical protein